MKATRRIGEVLSLFTSASPERSTGDVATILGIAHSSAHELLNGLAQTGLLRKQAPGRFRLGPMINSLSEVLTGTDQVIEASRGAVAEMAETYGETVHVIELVGERLMSLIGKEGSNQVNVSAEIVNSNLPPHLMAPGKVLLSRLPQTQLNRVLQGIDFTPATDDSVADAEILRAELEAIRCDCYAAEAGQYLPDLATVAAPITNHANICIAALALFIPKGRYVNEPRAFRNITLEAAQKISGRIGWESDQLMGTILTPTSHGATANPAEVQL